VEWVGAGDHLKLRLRVDSTTPQIALRLVLPEASLLGFLHVRFRTAARGLAPGSEKWQDGRFMLEWHAADGSSEPEINPLSSHSRDDQSGMQNVVSGTRERQAIPALRLEHLGRSGEFELSGLEIVAVEERQSWKIARWLMPLGWFAWAVAFIRSWPEISLQRASAAAGVWVAMGIYCAVPGPWKILRPMASDFRLGSVESGPAGIAPHVVPPTLSSGALPTIGKLPEQGDWVLRVKRQLVKARPLLHAWLFFCPTVWIAFWVGRRPALCLMLGMALAIEFAQVAFGYGFGWDDVLDLLSDAAGVVLALWTLGRLKKWSRRCIPKHQPA
jgi:hypothetical protein